MDDLTERLERANATLLAMAEDAKRKSDYDNQWRLEAKAEGVRLALSYIRDMPQLLDDYYQIPETDQRQPDLTGGIDLTDDEFRDYMNAIKGD